MEVVRQHEIRDHLLALSTFTPPDYVDVFVATAARPLQVSAETLARTAVEGSPRIGRVLAWQVTLGLRLDMAPSPQRIGGWRVDAGEEDWIRLEASSWFATAQMVFAVEAQRATFATLLRYDRAIARAVWTPAAVVHRAVAPRFLGDAVRRAEGGDGVQHR